MDALNSNYSSQNGKSSRLPSLVLLVICIAVWLWCAWYQLIEKTSLLDDAFIYLHIVNNILEIGSAQYFPIIDNPGLLASSPLRLLILIPSALIARWFIDPSRSIEAVRLTLVLSGIFSSLVFLPFYRRKLTLWLAGFIFAGLLCLSTETGLQMEGLLLFWVTYTLLLSFPAVEPNSRHFRKIGILTALLILTRPEYGLVALLMALVYTAWFRNRSYLMAFSRPVLVIGLGWIFITLLLNVHPVPTTYLSKLFTAKHEIFSSTSFTGEMINRIRRFFSTSPNIQPALIITLLAILTATILTINSVYRWAIVFVGLSFLMVHMKASNFLWYYENFFIVILTICLSFLLVKWREWRCWWRAARLVVVLIPLFLFFNKSLTLNYSLLWNFRADMSRGLTYQAIGESYVGRGLFKFGNLDQAYLIVDEIGIVSYFGGSQVWLIDASSLAQAGTLIGVKDHFLAWCFPKSIFRTADDEQRMILEKFNREPRNAKIFRAYGNPSLKDVNVCDHYFPDTGVCLKVMSWNPPE